MADTNTPNPTQEVAVSRTPLTFIPSPIGGTNFAFVGETKIIEFPAVGTVPALYIVEGTDWGFATAAEAVDAINTPGLPVSPELACPTCGDTPEWCPQARGTLRVVNRKKVRTM